MPEFLEVLANFYHALKYYQTHLVFEDLQQALTECNIYKYSNIIYSIRVVATSSNQTQLNELTRNYLQGLFKVTLQENNMIIPSEPSCTQKQILDQAERCLISKWDNFTIRRARLAQTCPAAIQWVEPAVDLDLEAFQAYLQKFQK